jgi:DNA repair protein RadD
MPIPLELRPYQKEAVASLWRYFEEGNAGHPLISMAVGTGKSLVMAKLAQDIMQYPDTTIAVIAPSQILVEQNYNELKKLWPEAPAGIYCAGLGRKDTHYPIIFGTIQSMYRAASRLPAIEIGIVDESHGIPHSQEGMWHTYINAQKIRNPDLRIIGLSGSPYRMSTGRLDEGKDKLFDKVVFEYSLKDGIEDGYLSPLITKDTKRHFDLSGVRTRSGDYVQDDLQKAVNKDDINKAVVKESIELAGDRKGWLFFCTGIEHSEEIARILREEGIGAVSITSKNSDEFCKESIEKFRQGRLQALVSVSMLDTGLNVPMISFIADVCPTKSPGRLVQRYGRGARKAEGKENCIAEGELVLTDKGLIPIESVTIEMKVWDGVDFVTHGGSVFCGEQEVITYAGLTATKDHKVWTEKGWCAFGDCALERASISITGSGWKAIRETEGYFTGGKANRRQDKKVPYFNGMLKMWQSCLERVSVANEVRGRMSQVREATISTILAFTEMRWGKGPMRQPKKQTLQRLWRAWYRVPLSYAAGYGPVDTREFRATGRYANRQDKQRGTLRGRESPLVNKNAKYGAYTESATYSQDTCLPAEIPACKICRLNNATILLRRLYRRANTSAVVHTVTQAKRRVWDIYNAGPLHRFTVSGLLVHNCLVADYSSNLLYHGPIDQIDGRKNPNKGGEAPCKICGECMSIVAAGCRTCPDCGHKFLFVEKQKFTATAYSGAILSSDAQAGVPQEIPVTGVRYSIHQKEGKPDSLKVTYQSGVFDVSEWIHFSLPGDFKARAEKWWRARSGMQCPMSAKQAIVFKDRLAVPDKVIVKKNGKYYNVVGYRWKQPEVSLRYL